MGEVSRHSATRRARRKRHRRLKHAEKKSPDTLWSLWSLWSRPSAILPAADALERRCPDHVDHERWQQAIADARRFLRRWSKKAAELDWTARDLFGLPPVPETPPASYQRLSRYDQIGLIWLLRGRAVLALTDHTAAIENRSGSITVYRRHNKPALGPVGDSLDDFDPQSSHASP